MGELYQNYRRLVCAACLQAVQDALEGDAQAMYWLTTKGADLLRLVGIELSSSDITKALPTGVKWGNVKKAAYERSRLWYG
jgi:hypothetical protein